MATFLIIEDEFIIAEDIRTSLIEYGCNDVTIYGNGEEAYHNILRTKPDLLLIDIVLEGKITGFELAEKVRKNFSIPIIYVTAHSDEKTLKKAAQTMPYGYLIKPFEDRVLLATLKIAYHKHNIELAAQEKEEKHKLVAKNIPELIKVMDIEGNIIFVSNSLETFLGIQQLCDIEKWISLVHPQAKMRISAMYKTISESDKVETLEYQIKNNENQYILVREKIYPFLTESYGKLFYSIYSIKNNFIHSK